MLGKKNLFAVVATRWLLAVTTLYLIAKWYFCVRASRTSTQTEFYCTALCYSDLKSESYTSINQQQLFWLHRHTQLQKHFLIKRYFNAIITKHEICFDFKRKLPTKDTTTNLCFYIECLVT
jgi:hypothetical protein